MTLFGLDNSQIAWLEEWWRVFGNGEPVPEPTDAAPFADVIFLRRKWLWERRGLRPVPRLVAA